MNHSLPLFLSAFLILLSACGGGEDNGLSGEKPKPSGSGKYDFVEYVFNESLSEIGDTYSYPNNTYDSSTGELIDFESGETFTKTDVDTIVETDYATNERIRTYEILNFAILETVHTAQDQERVHTRFFDIGETIVDADSQGDSPLGQQNATCDVIDHFDSFDINSETAEFNLGAGVYNDVLHLYCVTSFIIDGELAPHTLLNHYFAKDIGIIFTEGTMLLIGDIYIIPAR